MIMMQLKMMMLPLKSIRENLQIMYLVQRKYLKTEVILGLSHTRGTCQASELKCLANEF